MKTPQEWRAHLDTLPEPMTAPGPWAAKSDDSYELAAELTAKAMLIVADENPSLLAFPAGASDMDRVFADDLWSAAKARWPGLDDWLGGITGFMFGWANNLVRYIHEEPPVGNPAIVTINVGSSAQPTPADGGPS